MKVLMLAGSVDSYKNGPDGFIVDWARVLASKVDKLIILTYHFNPREQLPTNTQVILISGNNFLPRNIDLFTKTVQLSRRSDVIFAHILEIFGLFGGLAGKFTGKKCLFWYNQGYDLTKHMFAKLAFLSSDIILNASLEIKNRYVSQIGSWSKNKIKPIGQGVYLPHYRTGKKIKNKIIKILYAGRISPIKDVPTLQKAVEILIRKGINLSLEINSSYSYSNNAQIFKSADIIVVPTLSKCPDKVFLEGLVCKIPTIGTDNGYPFMIKDFPQFIFKAGDSVDLSNKIQWVIEHSKKANEIVTKANKYITANYNLEFLMEKFIAIAKTEVYNSRTRIKINKS